MTGEAPGSLADHPPNDHLVLLAPSGNRVYAAEANRLAAAELSIMLARAAETAEVEVEIETLAGVSYLRLPVADLDDNTGTALARLSGALAVFRRAGGCLHPVAIPSVDRFDDDLVGIPKYPGKTNEQFTRLLVNVTGASATRELAEDAVILDPLCGRGTTLSTGWTLGYDVAGVEADLAAVEAYDAFLRGYLRRKRIKHHAEFAPVRREGRSLGRRLERHGRRRMWTAGRCPSPCSPATRGSPRHCSGGDGSTSWSPTCRTGSCTAAARGTTVPAGESSDRRPRRGGASDLGRQLKQRRSLGVELEHLHPDPRPAGPVGRRRRTSGLRRRGLPPAGAPRRRLDPSRRAGGGPGQN